ncbi:uncharacterized protein B0T23DRAFT_440795 [Neurospora hispaniola]|uniref:Uncharacterized protein n=1 Tax=Neurospora hispaniola TaxID=588809 RepID=A0AAJ0IAU0_9PEZI|nr:hypothetical protein B0T23DRAFT_440795 [Neurospora hispaniola]
MPVVPKGQHLEDPGWWTLVDVGLLGHTFHFCVCSVGGFHQDSGSMPVLTARTRDCPTEEMKCSWLDVMGDADGRRCRKTEWVGRLCCTETREANSRQQASARDHSVFIRPRRNSRRPSPRDTISVLLSKQEFTHF